MNRYNAVFTKLKENSNVHTVLNKNVEGFWRFCAIVDTDNDNGYNNEEY